MGMGPRQQRAAPTAFAFLSCQDKQCHLLFVRSQKETGDEETERCLVTGVMVAILICPKFCSSAQEPKGEDRERVRERLAARMADLQLTDEQDTKIAEIKKECRPKVKAAAEELAAVVKDEVEKVRALLTPEQKEKLETLKEERKEHRFEGVAERIAHPTRPGFDRC